MIQIAPGCIVCPPPDRLSERRQARTVPIVTESPAKHTCKQLVSTGKLLCAHIRAANAGSRWGGNLRSWGNLKKWPRCPLRREKQRGLRERTSGLIARVLV